MEWGVTFMCRHSIERKGRKQYYLKHTLPTKCSSRRGGLISQNKICFPTSTTVVVQAQIAPAQRYTLLLLTKRVSRVRRDSPGERQWAPYTPLGWLLAANFTADNRVTVRESTVGVVTIIFIGLLTGPSLASITPWALELGSTTTTNTNSEYRI